MAKKKEATQKKTKKVSEPEAVVTEAPVTQYHVPLNDFIDVQLQKQFDEIMAGVYLNRNSSTPDNLVENGMPYIHFDPDVTDDGNLVIHTPDGNTYQYWPDQACDASDIRVLSMFVSESVVQLRRRLSRSEKTKSRYQTELQKSLVREAEAAFKLAEYRENWNSISFCIGRALSLMVTKPLQFVANLFLTFWN